MNFSKDFRFNDTQGVQLRAEIFNITNRLNYETLPQRCQLAPSASRSATRLREPLDTCWAR